MELSTLQDKSVGVSGVTGNRYIISDLHLSENAPGTTALFERFIDFICQDPQCEALYILGDFFNYWVGDDDLVPFHQTVINKLATLRSYGIRLKFMRGNRDFLIGSRFARQSGAEILADPCVINWHGHTIVLTHGDLLCTDDRGYQFFRCLARNRLLQKLFVMLPLRLRRRIGKRVRQQSRTRGERLYIAVDVTRKGVKRYRRHHPLIIHGHTHKMAVHQEDDGIRAVLSDWHDSGSYILLGQDRIAQYHWPSCELHQYVYT